MLAFPETATWLRERAVLGRLSPEVLRAIALGVDLGAIIIGYE